MPAVFRPRRSLLFISGSNPRALEKARSLPADGLIIDLEDAVAAEAKEEARAIVAAALAKGGYGGRELVLRVNPLDTPWGHADLAAAATLQLDAVLLPMVESYVWVRLIESRRDVFHLDLSDYEGFALVCRQGRELGFDGKTVIHPNQIGPANAAFAPSAAELEWSRRIIAAHAAAAAAGKGVVLVDGKLIEGLHVENARRLLGLVEGIEQIASVDTPGHAV